MFENSLFQDSLFTLFIAIASGLYLGRLKIAGLSLGSSGVIFTALVLGHLGCELPPIVGTLGLVLFVYCLGVNAGPSFFRVFGSQGQPLAILAFTLVLFAGALTWGIWWLADIPADLTVGIFAGAMTSTPALAAAAEALPPDSQIAVGFGIGYPFGVISVVLLVQLLPRLLGTNFDKLNQENVKRRDEIQIEKILVEVVNPAMFGKRLSEVAGLTRLNCQVPRVLQGEVLRPVPPDFTLQLGQHVTVIGFSRELHEAVELLGRPSDRGDYMFEPEHHRMKVVVGSSQLSGKTLRDLKLLSQFGITVARINRHDYEFIPRASDVIEMGDALTVVGETENLEAFAKFAGHREKAFFETDVASMTTGILVGVLLGHLEFTLGGQTISLGMAGGPLLVGLLLGHFGRIGPVRGHIPRASLMILTEMGLVFFLASVGLRAGKQLMPVVQEHGSTLCFAATIIAMIPPVFGFFLARSVLKLNVLRTLGGVCGGMTSTPGLGVVSQKVDSDVPVAAYVASYPVALILMTVIARVLVFATS